MVLSDEEKKEAARKRNKKYRKTSKYKRTNKKWRKKPEVRAKRRVQAQTYNRKSEVKEYRKEERQKPKVKANRKKTMKKYLTPKKRSSINKQKRKDAKKPERKIQRKKTAVAHKLAALKAVSKKTTNSKILSCACCGVKGIEFLTIDHIDEDGRKKMGHVGMPAEKLYIWIERKVQRGIEVPDGLQVLCFNCNIAKGHNFNVCPHTTKYA